MYHQLSNYRQNLPVRCIPNFARAKLQKKPGYRSKDDENLGNAFASLSLSLSAVSQNEIFHRYNKRVILKAVYKSSDGNGTISLITYPDTYFTESIKEACRHVAVISLI